MSQLLEATQRLLRETDQSFDEIAVAVGVSRRYVYMLAKEDVGRDAPGPGVFYLEKVHDYLVRRAKGGSDIPDATAAR